MIPSMFLYGNMGVVCTWQALFNNAQMRLGATCTAECAPVTPLLGEDVDSPSASARAGALASDARRFASANVCCFESYSALALRSFAMTSFFSFSDGARMMSVPISDTIMNSCFGTPSLRSSSTATSAKL